MIGTSNQETNHFLAQMGSLIPDASVWAGESPGFCHWLRIATPYGYVGVWDAEQLGEHGLFVQAYDLDPADDSGGPARSRTSPTRDPSTGYVSGPPSRSPSTRCAGTSTPLR